MQLSVFFSLIHRDRNTVVTRGARYMVRYRTKGGSPPPCREQCLENPFTATVQNRTVKRRYRPSVPW